MHKASLMLLSAVRIIKKVSFLKLPLNTV